MDHKFVSVSVPLMTIIKTLQHGSPLSAVNINSEQCSMENENVRPSSYDTVSTPWSSGEGGEGGTTNKDYLSQAFLISPKM